MLVMLVCAALFLAFSNGANDNFKGFATVWGSDALSYRRALLYATLATVAGGLVSLLIANGLVAQFSGKGLVSNDLANAPQFALAVAGGAAITVMLATRIGFPISTTHALVGGLVGAGLANGSDAVSFSNLGSSFVIPLLTSPFIAAFLGLAIYWTFRQFQSRRKNKSGDCICVVADKATTQMVPNDDGTVRASASLHMPSIIVADDAICDICEKPIARASISKMRDRAHIISATVICFARGVNDTPKLTALLLAAGLFDVRFSALAITAAMAIGGWLLARRVAETMSKKINKLDENQGISANLVTAVLVLFASKLGVPVSTTHVSVGSIIGTGGAAGTLDLSSVRAVILSWVATLPIAGLSAYLIASLL